MYIIVYLVQACVLACASLVFFKQKTAYEVRISDWSSDVCSSDLRRTPAAARGTAPARAGALAGSGQPAGHGGARLRDRAARGQIGRASCRERVCQYV